MTNRDKKRMRSRAWRSALSALILIGFTISDVIGLVHNPDFSHFIWLYLVGLSAIIESISAYFWCTDDLRGPLWSGLNQLWIGVLVCCNSVWAGLHPESLQAMIDGMPAAGPEKEMVMTIMKPLILPINVASGVIILLLQALIAYQFWTGGPRGYRPPIFQRSRNPEPASE